MGREKFVEGIPDFEVNATEDIATSWGAVNSRDGQEARNHSAYRRN